MVWVPTWCGLSHAWMSFGMFNFCTFILMKSISIFGLYLQWLLVCHPWPGNTNLNLHFKTLVLCPKWFWPLYFCVVLPARDLDEPEICSALRIHRGQLCVHTNVGTSNQPHRVASGRDQGTLGWLESGGDLNRFARFLCDQGTLGSEEWSNMAVCQNLVPLVNLKIAGKWMFIPLKMVLIGIDPYTYDQIWSNM